MKYSLIHKTTGEEHLCEKVKIERFVYYVSSGDIANEWYYHTYLNKILHRNNNHIDWLSAKKIIATTNPSIDIPQAIDNLMTPDYAPHFIEVWEEGYAESQSTHPFGAEDMIEFNQWLINKYPSEQLQNIGVIGKYSYNELLDIWQKQRIKVIYFQ